MFAENGMWLSLVERCVRDAKAAGSNPVIPTSINNQPIEISTFQWVFCFPRYPGIHEFPDHEKNDPDLDFLALLKMLGWRILQGFQSLFHFLKKRCFHRLLREYPTDSLL